MDLDGSGFIERAEIKHLAEKLFGFADGQTLNEEQTNGINAAFDFIDVSGDGKISPEELEQFFVAQLEQRGLLTE